MEWGRTTTSTALLEGLLRDDDSTIWAEFDDRYRPILLAFARKLGCDEEDAHDVAQETLTQFVRDYRRGMYDRTKGRLSSWILGIAHHRALDVHRRRGRRAEHRGDSAFLHLSKPDELERAWNEECRAAIIQRALRDMVRLRNMNERTVEAFRRQAFDQQDPKTVASDLGMTEQAAYLAKHRCLKAMREIISELTIAYELL
ncbi:MAG: sigma-70 family RNA polymerase sigma factor [Phycisphaerales bacterium]|nr:sigma-70 family RNA polymerase sigma factor [Phycisphaerales bacterium]